jgi:very-short-patch-repair endonuclease
MPEIGYLKCPSRQQPTWEAAGWGIMANEIARSLRKRMTPQEVKLWVHLRAWRKHGFHFRRQAPRDGHIVDFVCLKHRLIVEVDGGQHNFNAHAKRDLARDNHFAFCQPRVSGDAFLEP